MIRYSVIHFFCLLAISFSLLTPTTPMAAVDKTAAESGRLEGVAPEQIGSVLAKMSDEQVRSLLISELTSNPTPSTSAPQKTGGLVGKTAKWLHLLDEDEIRKKKSSSFLSRLTSFPGDYLIVARKVGRGSLGNFILSLAMLFGIFGAAWGSEYFTRRFTANFRKQFQEKAIPVLDGPMRFIAGLMLSIPSLVHIFVFATAALLFFFMLPGTDYSPLRYVFLALLFSILFYRLLAQFSRILSSPGSAALRVLPFDDITATTVHRATLFLCSYIFTAIMFLALQRELGLSKTALHSTVMIIATFLVFVIVLMIMRSRHYVANRILDKSDQNGTRNWVIEQFAQFWHVPTILYVLIIWTIMLGDQLTGVQRGNSAFLMSLTILPLFVIFNGLGQWIVRVSINTLRMYNHEDEDSASKEIQASILVAKEKERKLYVTTSRFMSLSILVTLLVWTLSLWDVYIPYATNITKAVFQSLIAVALGLTVWKFSSSYIEKKILETMPVDEEKEENDDEWGGAATRGRSFTLLPMLRKFIASTLLVMVTLVILSSMGVDIGPLLAGAGVVGLAIGFGAQKMVSDVFSGFFYLLDDAFRVGEYIQAGSVSGAVESISLRNVMLRHHRGMLQIVPHSELGSITNFMRGGIIVKFNLEFSYDADIDQIRKIIKKVGQAMLADDEFKDDFIQPVKSAGVREITGSVMIIRVKFKAQPGTQFVIQREAYRRISEALAAKGIHYAHRKVIVELPETANITEENKKVLEAGAAAALLQQQEEENTNEKTKS